MWHPSLVDVSLGVLFDSVVPTQADVLLSEDIQSSAHNASGPLKTPKEVTSAVNLYSRISFAVIDTITQVVARPIKSRGAAIAQFPKGGHISPHKSRPPISRIYLRIQWSDNFFEYCQHNKSEDDEKPPRLETTAAHIVLWDGSDVWTTSICFEDLRSMQLDDCAKLYQTLGIGTRRKPNEKTGVLFSVHDTDDHVANLQLICAEEKYFKADGIQCCLANAQNRDESISSVFVSAYKQHILAQHLTASLLLSLTTLQRASIEVLKDGKQLAAHREESERMMKSKVLQLLNTKKRRIAELQAEVEQLKKQLQANSPTRRSVSPARRSASPTRRSPSPARQSPSPSRRRRSSSPARRSASPVRRSSSPPHPVRKKRNSSPRRSSSPPRLSSPLVEIASPPPKRAKAKAKKGATITRKRPARTNAKEKATPHFKVYDQLAISVQEAVPVSDGSPKQASLPRQDHRRRSRSISPPRRSISPSPRRLSEGAFIEDIPHRCVVAPFRIGDRNIEDDTHHTRRRAEDRSDDGSLSEVHHRAKKPKRSVMEVVQDFIGIDNGKVQYNERTAESVQLPATRPPPMEDMFDWGDEA